MIGTKWREAYKEAVGALRSTYFFPMTIFLGAVLLVAATMMYLLEYDPKDPHGFWDSLWWAMVTVTTVGYGDIVPKTVPGRLVGFGVMISGLFLLSIMTASIASVFVTRRIKEGKGLEDIRDKDHIVICGWNDGGIEVIRGLYHQLRPRFPVVVLINELPREEVDSVFYRFQEMSFRYVRGNFAKEDILARANISQARAAIILADASGNHPPERTDQRTIFGSLAIKSMAPKVKICAELKNPENREHLQRAAVDEIVAPGEYNAGILAGAASASGLSTVMKRLLSVDEENKMWRTRINERWVGKTVRELADHYREKYKAILLAIVTEANPMKLEDILSGDATALDEFIRRKFEESGKDFFASGKQRISVQINPSPETVITGHDAAIVLGRAKPGEASILEKGLDIVTGAMTE
jgi:voltage-gated potassium channel